MDQLGVDMHLPTMLLVKSLKPAAMDLTRLTLRRSDPPYTKLCSAARMRGVSSASMRRATYQGLTHVHVSAQL